MDTFVDAIFGPMLTMFSEHSVVETNHDHQSDFSDILISLQTKREM